MITCFPKGLHAVLYVRIALTANCKSQAHAGEAHLIKYDPYSVLPARPSIFYCV